MSTLRIFLATSAVCSVVVSVRDGVQVLMDYDFEPGTRFHCARLLAHPDV